MTDESGLEIEHTEYKPFGSTWIQSKAGDLPDSYSLPYKFTGQEKDAETDLYYYGARYYDPVLCNFTQTDPLMGSGGFASFNPWSYVSWNPVSLVDPTGMAGLGFQVPEKSVQRQL
jgi:RHS repeat-associated protein